MVTQKDMTVGIPVRIDTEDRRDNLYAVVGYLLDNFEMPVVVIEGAAESRLGNLPSACEHLFLKMDTPYFHKTRVFNHFLRQVTSPAVAIYDADVIVSTKYWNQGLSLLGQCDFVLPHKEYRNCLRQRIPEIIRRCSAGDSPDFPDMFCAEHASAVGGIHMALTKSYKESGGDNECFLGWGPEDMERLIRWQRLEYAVYRIQDHSAILYHFDHGRTMPREGNLMSRHNNRELERVDSMSKEDLQAYIQMWPWNKW